MGCKIEEEPEGLVLNAPAQLSGVSVDMHWCEDTFMALAVIAPFAQSPTTITNIGHMRLQETDRLSAMRAGLQLVGIKVEEGNDWLRIYPGEPQPAVIDSGNDCRVGMAFAVMGLKTGITIENAGCVARNYPDFFRLLESF